MARANDDRHSATSRLLGDPTGGARFHTGPIGPSHPALAGLGDPKTKRPTAAGSTNGGNALTLETDYLSPVVNRQNAPTEPTTHLMPDPAPEPSLREALAGDPAQARINALLQGLPADLIAQVWATPRAEFAPVMEDVSGALTVLVMDHLPARTLTLPMLDRLNALPPADRCRVLVATLAALTATFPVDAPEKQADAFRDRLRAAEADLRQRVEAQLPPVVRDAIAVLPPAVQQRLLIAHAEPDIATGEYSELNGASGAPERLRQNLLAELNVRCGLAPDNTFEAPVGLPDVVYATLYTMPAAAAVRILSTALHVPEGESAKADAVVERLRLAVRECLAGDLPDHLQPALQGLDPEVLERVLTTGLTDLTADDMAGLVRRNLEITAKQALGRLPKTEANLVKPLLGLNTTPPANPDLPQRTTTHVATLCAFLAGVRVPEAATDLTATARDQAVANARALTGEHDQVKAALKPLDDATETLVTSMLKQGLVTGKELLAIIAPDGTKPATADVAADRVMMGMAKLATERLHLTAPDTFSPPIGQADAQGSRWQPQQVAAIAHTVLQGLRDGTGHEWENLHFALEVPQMPDGYTLLDQDLGAMRFGRYLHGKPGKPPTMMLSALDANPQASAAVQGAWKRLWSEISSGRHYLGNGDPTANTMAGMLQAYLQEQQMSWISDQQQPVSKALKVHVERTAASGTGADRDLAAQLLTSSSGLRSDMVATLWALHQTITTAQGSKTGKAAALLRLQDYLGTVPRRGPEAQAIRQYLGDELNALGATLQPPKATVDDWLAGADDQSHRQTPKIVVKSGETLSHVLLNAGGGRGPEAILAFLRLNQHLTGPQAITVSVQDEHAKKLRLTGKRVNGLITYSAANFVAKIEADRKLLDGLRTRGGLQNGPGANPQRTLTISEAEARRIGHFDKAGLPDTTLSADRLWQLVELAQSRNDDAVRMANVQWRTGTTVVLPSRTHGYSENPNHQLEIDHLDARTQLLGFVGGQLQAELTALPKVSQTLAKDIVTLQKLETPLQADGRFGAQTLGAMQRLEESSKMGKVFDPTTWYRHMLTNAMPVTHHNQNFWVALTTHEMIGHGSEHALMSRWAESLQGAVGDADQAYDQVYQFWGYGVFGFLDGDGKPPIPTSETVNTDARTVAAHATIGTGSLADGAYTFNPGAGFITPYAKSNPAEAWAESLRFFTQRPETLLRESPAAFLFINELLGTYDARQIMALAAQPGAFQTPAAAKIQLAQAVRQLSNVQHPSINLAVVQKFAGSPRIDDLRTLLDGQRDAGVAALAHAIAVAGNPLGLGAPSLEGPEQRALGTLLLDPAKAAAWAAAVRDHQPFSDDPSIPENGAILLQARHELEMAGLSPADIKAIPDRTLLRWVAEADDLVTLAHIRRIAEAANPPHATESEQGALEALLLDLNVAPGARPVTSLPAEVWARTSPACKQRLTNVIFTGDLRHVGKPMPRGTYELMMTRPNDLVSEMGQTLLMERSRALGLLENSLQVTLFRIIQGVLTTDQGATDVGGLIPLAKSELATHPRLLARYTQFLDSLESSVRYYAGGGASPPPAGTEELWEFTQDGLANALDQLTVVRQQLGLSSAPSGTPNANSTTAL
jgi:hypothetical protein